MRPLTLTPIRLRATAALPLPLTQTLARPLSTTTPTSYRQQKPTTSPLPIPSARAQNPDIPPYPYGPRQTYHQSNMGLYGSASIRFGNRVSARNEIKTRRKWRPNVQSKRLWSEALGVLVRTRVTTRVLRTIDKVGGLDNYLLGSKTARIKDLGPWGWKLRWRIMQTPLVRERLAREREALGLPPVEVVEDVMEEVMGGGEEGKEGLVRKIDEALKSGDEVVIETAEDVYEEGEDVVKGEAKFMAEERPRK